MSRQDYRQIIDTSLERSEHYLLTRNFGRAFAHFMVVFRLSPGMLTNVKMSEDFVFCLAQLGQQLENQGKIEDLFTFYNEALEMFPLSSKLHVNFGSHLIRLEYWDQATYYLRRANELDPSSKFARHLFENVSNCLIERWHFPMLNCEERNSKFRNAIRNAIAIGHNVVLDIGTGTGILSMFATNSGALKTYACEMSVTMYRMAQEILVANSMEGKVKLFHKKSTDLEVSIDLEERVSLVVTETFDAALFGEHILKTLTHAWDNLLLPRHLGGMVVPIKTVVWASVIESKTIRNRNRSTYAAKYCKEFGKTNYTLMTEPIDYDYTTERLTELKGGYRNVCNPITIFTVDFNDVEGMKKLMEPQSFNFDVCCTENASLDAVALWFDLYLDDDNVLSTNPSSSTCWEQAIFMLAEDLEVTKESSITIEIRMAEGTIERIRCTPLSPNTSIPIDSLSISSESPRIVGIPSNLLDFLNDQIYSDALSDVVLSLRDEENHGYRTLVSSWATMSALSVARCVSGEITCVQNALNSNVIQGLSEILLPKIVLNAATEETVIGGGQLWDVFVAQVIESCGMLNNEAVREVALLKESVMTPSRTVIPFAIQCWAVLIESATLVERNRVCSDERTLGLKIASHLNYYEVSSHQDIELATLPHEKLCEPIHVLEINFKDNFYEAGSQPSLLNCANTASTLIRKSGKISAIVYWFVIRLTADISVSTLDPQTHWRQAAYVLNSEIPVQTEQTVKVTAAMELGILDLSLHCD